MNGYPENLYQLECHSEHPILWLNSDHKEVCEALDSNANVGRRARMRDVFFDTVSNSVWTRLILKAARDMLDTDEPPHEWEEAVLEQFLPGLYPECADYESRLHALRDDLREGDESYVLERLDCLLQSRLDLAKHMTKLVESGE